MNKKTLNATGIGSQTCVGHINTKFPMIGGNCFDLTVGKTASYRVINFRVENFRELLKRGIIAWPVKIRVVAKGKCVVHDTRIPNEWFAKDFCSGCTPYRLMPLSYKLEREREIQTGVLKIGRAVKSGPLKGMRMESRTIQATRRKLDVKWSTEAVEDFKIAAAQTVEPWKLDNGILKPNK